MLGRTPARQIGRRVFLVTKRKVAQFVPNNLLIHLLRSRQKTFAIRQIRFFKTYEADNDCQRIINSKEVSINILNLPYSASVDEFWRVNGSSARYSRLWQIELHSMKFLECVDRKEFDRLITAWIEQCPLYSDEYWYGSWNAYAVSVRIVVWIKQYMFLSQRSSINPDHIVVQSLRDQLCFLESNLETDVPGNHLVKNCTALLWGAEFFEGDDALRWRNKGVLLLRKIIRLQILDDGVHFERSPAYHNLVLQDFLECWEFIHEPELKVDLKEVVTKMIQASVDLTHPDGDLSMFSDGCKKVAPKLKSLLACAKAQGFINPEPRGQFSYPQAGLSGWRDKSQYILIDHGPIGPPELPGHGHLDMFSFEWTVGGQRLIIDQGVYEYQRGENRDRSRSTLSHNTLSLSRQEQADFWGEFRLGSIPHISSEVASGAREMSVCGWHTGFARLRGSPVHQRKFTVSASSVHITDSVQGGARQSAEIQFLIHPAFDLSIVDYGLIIHGRSITVDLFTIHPVAILEAEWFPEFGRRERCRQIQIRFGVGQGPWETLLKIRKDSN